MENIKIKILLEAINDVIMEYPNSNDVIEQKLNEQCDREGMSIDKIICFLISLKAN